MVFILVCARAPACLQGWSAHAFLSIKVCILLLTAVSTVHSCILFVGMFSIFVFTATSGVHKCSLFILEFFLKWLFFDKWERYIKKRTSMQIHSVSCRISTSKESGKQPVVESQRIKSY